jgi:hypothetical protein
MITVMPMAFVWSRLALAALLAAGAACAPAEACPGTAGDDADAPQLACCDKGQAVLLDLGTGGFGDAILAETPSVASTPRIAITITPPAAHHAPAITRDVLVVAPKTSPPQT